MSDSEQYNEECGNCNCKLTEDTHIFCLSRGDEEQVWCADCVHSFWHDLKSEGWTADNETWSELGFDDDDEESEESEEEKPAPKVSVNYRNAMRLEDEYNAEEEAKRKAQEQ
jgi:hypothetical protein